jgi:hypothetical protein
MKIIAFFGKRDEMTKISLLYQRKKKYLTKKNFENFKLNI